MQIIDLVEFRRVDTAELRRDADEFRLETVEFRRDTAEFRRVRTELPLAAKKILKQRRKNLRL